MPQSSCAKIIPVVSCLVSLFMPSSPSFCSQHQSTLATYKSSHMTPNSPQVKANIVTVTTSPTEFGPVTSPSSSPPHSFSSGYILFFASSFTPDVFLPQGLCIWYSFIWNAFPSHILPPAYISLLKCYILKVATVITLLKIIRILA